MDAPLSLTLTPLESAEDLATEWRQAAASWPRSFFLSWDWIGTWLATLPAGLPLFVARMRRGVDPVGLALLGVADSRQLLRAPVRSINLNATGDEGFDCIAVEHNGFLCAPADDAAFMAALGDRFVADDGRIADQLNLPGVGQILSLPFIDRNGLLHSTKAQQGFTVDLARVAEAGGDFASLLSANGRQQLRRTLRDFEQEGAVEISAARDTAEALRFFDAMKALHIASWARRRQRHAFAAPYFERFHRALISRAFAAGSIQLLRVAVAGRDVGYLYNFRQNGRIYAYQSGLDDADRKRRPGVLSHAMAIRFNALNGDKIYDFLAGENQLKASFADSTYPIAWQVVRLPRLKYRIESAARHLKQRLLG